MIHIVVIAVLCVLALAGAVLIGFVVGVLFLKRGVERVIAKGII